MKIFTKEEFKKLTWEDKSELHEAIEVFEFDEQEYPKEEYIWKGKAVCKEHPDVSIEWWADGTEEKIGKIDENEPGTTLIGFIIVDEEGNNIDEIAADDGSEFFVYDNLIKNL